MKPQREQLETLAAVIDAGTFDAAARALGVTPSAVSQRVKALEQQLGRVLVVREKPIRATESGEPLVRLARHFVAHHGLRQLERQATGQRQIGDTEKTKLEAPAEEKSHAREDTGQAVLPTGVAWYQLLGSWFPRGRPEKLART